MLHEQHSLVSGSKCVGINQTGINCTEIKNPCTWSLCVIITVYSLKDSFDVISKVTTMFTLFGYLTVQQLSTRIEATCQAVAYSQLRSNQILN